MLSILISFPVFSFTGLSRPAYKLFLIDEPGCHHFCF